MTAHNRRKLSSHSNWPLMASELVSLGFPTSDLSAVRTWFESVDEEMARLPFGHALHTATEGASTGFKLWVAWSKSVDPTTFDLAHHLILWRKFAD